MAAVRWKQQDGPGHRTTADLQVSHYLIGSLHAGTAAALVGGTQKLTGGIVIRFSKKKRKRVRLIKRDSDWIY